MAKKPVYRSSETIAYNRYKKKGPASTARLYAKWDGTTVSSRVAPTGLLPKKDNTKKNRKAVTTAYTKKRASMAKKVATSKTKRGYNARTGRGMK